MSTYTHTSHFTVTMPPSALSQHINRIMRCCFTTDEVGKLLRRLGSKVLCTFTTTCMKIPPTPTHPRGIKAACSYIEQLLLLFHIYTFKLLAWVLFFFF